MKSLAERHADRAQRKADNLAESSAMPVTTGNMGNAARLIDEAHAAFNALTPEQQAELSEAMGNVSAADGFKSLAEDETGNLTMAGIGVVNPFLVPGGAYNEANTSGVQADGALPDASFDPKNGNLNGAAIENAGNGAGAGGWGVFTPEGDGYGALTLNELKTKLEERELSYDKKVKDTQEGKDSLIAVLRGADEKKADAAE